MSLGFEQAGFDVVAAAELDPIHASVHKFNFPNCAVLAKSVVDIDGRSIKKAAGLALKQKVHVVFGGAPCQGFSLIGQRMLDDPRNALVRHFVRLVKELDSDYFVFENVKGLTVGSHKSFLDELVELFEKAGYSVRLPWKVLNAFHYGVPQDRERLFLLGARKGLPVPNYPNPVTCPAGSEDFFKDELPAGPSCEDALGDLPEAELYEELLDGDCVQIADWNAPSAYARKMRCMDGDAWGFGYKRKWNPGLLSSSRRTNHSRISRRRFSETPGGEVEPISRFFRLPAAGVSNTLRAGTDSSRGAFTSPRPIHYAQERCITVREMARLHGFPDWFRFNATKWHGARQIGNAVPPPLARSVASEIIAAIGIRPTRPRKILELGNPELLYLDMSQAARYWQVPVPIGKRDRKSGAKKRKQDEIEAQRLQFGEMIQNV